MTMGSPKLVPQTVLMNLAQKNHPDKFLGPKALNYWTMCIARRKLLTLDNFFDTS